MIKKYIFLNKKILLILNIGIIIPIFSISCNTIKQNLIKDPNIEQGINLTTQHIQKIHIGTTKSNIINIIGYPTLKDPFGSNTWYYIDYHYYPNKYIKTHIFELIFDSNDILISINNFNS